MESKINNSFKIALIGDKGTGKSYLLNHLKEESSNFLTRFFSCLSYEKEILIDGQNLTFKIEILEDFSSSSKLEHDGYALIYNFNNSDSYKKLLEIKNNIFSKVEKEDLSIFPIIIIQNKTLIDGSVSNFEPEIKSFLNQNKFFIFKIYINNKINIEESFNNWMKQVKDYFEAKLFPELRNSYTNRERHQSCNIF